MSGSCRKNDCFSSDGINVCQVDHILTQTLFHMSLKSVPKPKNLYMYTVFLSASVFKLPQIKLKVQTAESEVAQYFQLTESFVFLLQIK